jgi:hypothetical protein
LSFWLRRSKSKSVDRLIRVEVRNSPTFWARVGLKDMLRKSWISERSAVNVWMVVWMFGVSLGSGGCVGVIRVAGVRVDLDLIVMAFTVRERSEWRMDTCGQVRIAYT